MDVVAAWVAEVHFAVVDDRVRPVGDVERAVGALLYINRAEVGFARADEVWHSLRDEAGFWIRTLTEIIDGKTHDAMRAEVVRDGVALPVVGEERGADDFEAAEFRVAAGRDALEDFLRVFVGEIHGAGNCPRDALAARAVGDEGVAVCIELMAPRIAPATEHDLDFFGARIPSKHTAAVQPHDAPRRFDVAVDVDALVHVEATIGAPAKCVERVVCVLGAEAGEHCAAAVRAIVEVGIVEFKKIGGCGDVGGLGFRLRIFANGFFFQNGCHARGDEQVAGERRGFVGFAIAVGVFEDHDFVVGMRAGGDHRIDGRAGDPQATCGVPIHADGLREQRRLGPEREFHSIGDGEIRRSEFGDFGRGGLWSFGDLGFFAGILFDAVNLRLGLSDERVELGNLDGISALFTFTETKNVSVVRRAPAVEKEIVLFEDGCAQSWPRGFAPAELAGDTSGKK